MVKQRENDIVRRVALIDDYGGEVVPVNRFLSHLIDSGYSLNTVCAYGYDLPDASVTVPSVVLMCSSLKLVGNASKMAPLKLLRFRAPPTLPNGHGWRRDGWRSGTQRPM